jgi:MEDS: MEthanogen/methylotroph, DcmR Sensory domain
MSTNSLNDWKRSKADTFWGEIAPCDHVVQIYETDETFINALVGFVGAGINSNDSCIVIATPKHLAALEEKLSSYGVSISTLIAENRYVPLDAEETLSAFMVNGWPDEARFIQTISSILYRAHGKNRRKIRAFGEMVAILWAQGNAGATLNLEHLWTRLSHEESFCLFCAYPKVGFTEDLNNSIQQICSAHSKMIDGNEKQLTDVIYRETGRKQAG